jgi:hypothetical protein
MPRYSETIRPLMFVETTHPQITRLYHGDRFQKKPRGMDAPRLSGYEWWEVIHITADYARRESERRIVSVGGEMSCGWSSRRERKQVISQFQAFLQKCALGEMIRTQQWLRQLKTYEMPYYREAKKRLLGQAESADDTAAWLVEQGWKKHKTQSSYTHEKWPQVRIIRKMPSSFWSVVIKTGHGRVETAPQYRLASAVEALSSLLRIENQLSHLKDIP